jgi:Xaa-Pro aminopeptidase
VRHILALTCLLAGPALAQMPEPVPQLPGAGRPVDAEAYRARRARLSERIGNGIVLVPAASRRDLEVDVLHDGDFRQDDYFYYLTGVETPDAWLLLVAANGATRSATLYLPPVSPHAVQWTGVQLAPGPEAERLAGIEQVVPLYPDSLDRAVMVALMRSEAPLFTVMYSGSRDNEHIRRWMTSGRDVRNVVPLMDSLRVVKDELGLASLRTAIDITTEAVRVGMQAVRPGMYERQLEAVIEYTFRDRGADRLGFPSIVGSGPNSVVLHYDANRRKMEAGDLVVVDVGAEYAQYTADVSRTFPVSGRFTERQKAIYDVVLATHEAVIEAAKPGMTMGDLGRLARQYMSEHGGDLCGPRGCARYFVHGLSHWLGMRVHDVGDYRMTLEPGMVLTIEPGIYLPDENLGVRIEDDVLITESGAEILSNGAPRTTEDIERLMQSAERPQATGSR